jgi:hypothetical protein
MAKDQGMIQFSQNWNCRTCGSAGGKLHNKVFTTIRLYNPEKYKVGDVHQVLLKKKDGWLTDFGRAEIVDVRKIYGNQLNDCIALLDTGYLLDDYLKLIQNFYPEKNIKETAFSYVFYKYVEE